MTRVILRAEDTTLVVTMPHVPTPGTEIQVESTRVYRVLDTPPRWVVIPPGFMASAQVSTPQEPGYWQVRVRLVEER